ncbi:MAG: SH3 domain-containing protein [Rhodomicrobiaceae bacterium]
MRQFAKAALFLAVALGSANIAQADYVTECPYAVKGVAYNDVLNIRRWPSPQSRLVGVIPPNGSGVYLIRWKGNWGLINYGHYEGWVNMRYLRAYCD